MQKTPVSSLGQEDPLDKEMATHSSILALENPMDRRVWWATVHRVTRSWTGLSDGSTHRELYWPGWDFSVVSAVRSRQVPPVKGGTLSFLVKGCRAVAVTFPMLTVASGKWLTGRQAHHQPLPPANAGGPSLLPTPDSSFWEPSFSSLCSLCLRNSANSSLRICQTSLFIHVCY